MARCQKCGTKIRKLSRCGKSSRCGCPKCLGILKMRQGPYTIHGHPCR